MPCRCPECIDAYEQDDFDQDFDLYSDSDDRLYQEDDEQYYEEDEEGYGPPYCSSHGKFVEIDDEYGYGCGYYCLGCRREKDMPSIVYSLDVLVQHYNQFKANGSTKYSIQKG